MRCQLFLLPRINSPRCKRGMLWVITGVWTPWLLREFLDAAEGRQPGEPMISPLTRTSSRRGKHVPGLPSEVPGSGESRPGAPRTGLGATSRRKANPPFLHDSPTVDDSLMSQRVGAPDRSRTHLTLQRSTETLNNEFPLVDNCHPKPTVIKQDQYCADEA